MTPLSFEFVLGFCDGLGYYPSSLVLGFDIFAFFI
jgi:hypothetical protein